MRGSTSSRRPAWVSMRSSWLSDSPEVKRKSELMNQAMGATTFGYDAAFLGTTLARKSFKDVSGLPPASCVYPFALYSSSCDFAGQPWGLSPTRCTKPAGLS